jgi:collagenase-like PrtC family protease
MQPINLTMGPVLFNWAPEVWRDYHFRIADEAPVKAIYVGEVVCSKRAPFIEPHFEAVVERLKACGKDVVVSLLAEVMSKVDRRLVEGMLELEGVTFEVNDASQLAAVNGRPHAVGPFFNVYNEGTLCYLAHRGAKVFCLPYELPMTSIAVMGKAAAEHGVEMEVQVYGRVPLALSARCYHARAHGLTKDGCQFVCEKDPDGMDIETLDGKPFLTINGIQTMSHKYANLLRVAERLQEAGVSRFRLSPDSGDMVEVARIFRDHLDQRIRIDEAMARLLERRPGISFADGFALGRPGTQWSYGGRSGGEAVTG